MDTQWRRKQIHGRCILNGLQESTHCLVPDRIHLIRRNFRQRLENEPALGISGMRDLEALALNNEIVEENDVDIQGTGPVWKIPLTLARVLDLKANPHKVFGFQFRFSFHRGVQKPWLGKDLFRLGRVNRGGSKDGNTVSFQAGKTGF